MAVDIALKKIGDIQTLAAGYNYEGIIDLSTADTGGIFNLKVGGSDLAGTISKAAIVVDELVPEASSNPSPSTFTSCLISMGDNDDSGVDNLIEDIQVEATNAGVVSVGTEHVNTGASITGTFPLLTDNIDVLVTTTGETDEQYINGGKVRVFLQYNPTAGQGSIL